MSSSLERAVIAIDEASKSRKSMMVPHIDFEAYMEKRHQDIAAIRSPTDFRDSIVEYFEAGGALQGKTLPWMKTHDLIRIRPAEVSVWHGYSGHGKSLLLGQVISHLAAHGEKCCIASMEMPPPVTLSRMAKQTLGSGAPTNASIDKFLNWGEGKLWLFDQQETVSTQRILGVIQYVVDTYGVTQFVVDSLMKCGVTKETSSATFSAQMRIVEEICAIAKKTNAHIHLVAHDRKPDGGTEQSLPHKLAISGTSDISNQVDNVFGVWWNKAKFHDAEGHINEADAKIICDKQRNGAWEGDVALWFDRDSTRYLGSEGEKVWPLLK